MGAFATDARSPFAATDLALLSSVVDHAASKGLRIVLDTHNYARRRVIEDGWSAEHLIGSELVPAAAFTDYCRRLAASFQRHPSVIFRSHERTVGACQPKTG